jgi:hypothetical protein
MNKAYHPNHCLLISIEQKILKALLHPKVVLLGFHEDMKNNKRPTTVFGTLYKFYL